MSKERLIRLLEAMDKVSTTLMDSSNEFLATVNAGRCQVIFEILQVLKDEKKLERWEEIYLD